MGALLLLGSCRRAPAWLAEAPLVGFRYQDDEGRTGYLAQPPKKIAVLSPGALGLWTSSQLPVTLLGCLGMQEDYRQFYLPCDNPVLLQEALSKAKVEWLWVDKRFSWPDSLSSPCPIFRFDPKSLEDWLQRLKLLGKVYDASLVIQQADSLLREIHILQQNLAKARKFRVLVLAPGSSLALVTSSHPLGRLIEEAGGQILKADQPLIEDDVTQKVLESEPEIIIVAQETAEQVNALLTVAPQLYTTPALRHKRVFSMERRLLEQPMAWPVETFYQLVRILHPELVGQAPSAVEEPADTPEDQTQDDAQ